MCDLSDFERGKIVGARLAGASVTKTADSFSVSRATVSTVMTAYTKHGKTSSAKKNSGRNPKLTDRDRRLLKRIVDKQYKTTAAKVTAELNTHLSNTVSTKTVRRELQKTKIPGRAKLGGGFENVQTTTQGSSGLLNVEETPTPTSSIETEDSNTREVGEKDVEGDGEQSD